ncbi:peptidase [Planobispora rosea]|uniref:Peptidase n=1 Tax=Planobispora rosea TaxID=35762 RepID=A0A8J3RX95_PLARO|nr:neutral zinc metallopeptidase [Planobispora rosea]GGS51994.1 peptidase [Planobispora rosea]GIH82995.1 peptidase [Planobispora rosea]
MVPVGTAQAQPGQSVVQGRAAATDNPLYRTGAMPVLRCPAGTIRAGSASSYRSFMSRVNRCLGRAWTIQFRRAGLPFSPPKLRFVTSRVGSPCGRWPAGAGGYYCSTDRTMYIGVTRKVLKNPYGPNHAQFMAHEYAHHVQHLAGILPYYAQATWRATSPGRLAFSRRLELQADCLASAFLRGAATDLKVTREHWNAMIEWTAENGHKAWPTNDHGLGRSQALWMQRGFASGSPASCNTWTAARSKVS